MPRYSLKTDKHILYQKAVQSPDAEVDFCDWVYRRIYGKKPTRFREDFCGTGLISCAWVKLRSQNVAYGIDLDKPTLDWGRKHNIGRLPPAARRRVHQINGNVVTVRSPKVHVIGAFNYSYFVFKERRELVRYFRACRRSLFREGLLILDAYGGWEAQKVMKERTRLRGFTYIWDQAKYNPVNDHTVCHIHFKFPDGTRMNRAFTYDWRLWSLGSIRDALADAGFARSDVYWDDEDDDTNGAWRPRTTAENDPGWNAYVVARP